jgi:hypothetical protein
MLDLVTFVHHYRKFYCPLEIQKIEVLQLALHLYVNDKTKCINKVILCIELLMFQLLNELEIDHQKQLDLDSIVTTIMK